MTDAIKSVLDAGDLAALTRLLADAPARADEEIRWGEHDNNRCCPLHYLCHLYDDGRVDAATAVALADALIAAGADLEFPQGSGDTPLIAAASLWAPEIGLRLIAAGANVRARGLFKATALHWASMLGLPTLVPVLLEAGAELDLKDVRYDASPLGWAVHGRATRLFGGRGDPLACAKLLVAAGARIEPKWLASEPVKADAALLAALV
jgi:hypothetical protein